MTTEQSGQSKPTSTEEVWHSALTQASATIRGMGQQWVADELWRMYEQLHTWGEVNGCDQRSETGLIQALVERDNGRGFRDPCPTCEAREEVHPFPVAGEGPTLPLAFPCVKCNDTGHYQQQNEAGEYLCGTGGSPIILDCPLCLPRTD